MAIKIKKKYKKHPRGIRRRNDRWKATGRNNAHLPKSINGHKGMEGVEFQYLTSRECLVYNINATMDGFMVQWPQVPIEPSKFYIYRHAHKDQDEWWSDSNGWLPAMSIEGIGYANIMAGMAALKAALAGPDMPESIKEGCEICFDHKLGTADIFPCAGVKVRFSLSKLNDSGTIAVLPSNSRPN